MPEIIAAQRTPEWLEARKGKITASVAAACLGVGSQWEIKDGELRWVHKPVKSRQSAWREIVGRQTDAEQRHSTEDFNVRYGLNFEPIARASYEAETGNLVMETGLWVHPDLPWLAASPDGLIGRDGVLECKCLVRQVPMVPIQHRIQCLIQLACTGRKWADYYNWPKPPEAPQLWRIDRAGIPGLIVRLKAFYDQYVLTGVQPPRRKK